VLREDACVYESSRNPGSLLQVVAKSGKPPEVLAQSEAFAAQSPMFFGPIFELINTGPDAIGSVG
jgi:hypothetical protein